MTDVPYLMDNQNGPLDWVSHPTFALSRHQVRVKVEGLEDAREAITASRRSYCGLQESPHLSAALLAAQHRCTMTQ